jgi:glucose/arabinose dehydrogenase
MLAHLRTIATAALVALATLASAATLPKVVSGFTLTQIATISGARELASAPNGDLFVGTASGNVYVVPHAEATTPGTPRVFYSFSGSPAAGVALGGGYLFVGTEFAVYEIPYRTGDLKPRAPPRKIASVRTSGVSRDHVTTSVAYDRGILYASVGSSCNACHDLDATRATIQKINLRTGRMSPEAIRIRNAIALTVNPQTGTLWAGVAGVDNLQVGQPYEIFDAVTLHGGVVDYGWPVCYDNRRHAPGWPGSCAHVAIPRVIMPAYETPIGAVFYPAMQRGRFAFPSRYRGGAFVTLHGSWHGPAQGLSGFVPPRVIFIPMRGDMPSRPADWSDPNTQWTEFISGYQEAGTSNRIGRPTGITVGPQGSLFVADDESGAIYRVRPY